MKNPELEEKLSRVRAFMEKEKYDAVLFRRNDSFSWLTCGGCAFVDKGAELANASLLVTLAKVTALYNSSEKFRIPEEELADLPFEMEDYTWNQDPGVSMGKYLDGKRTASDTAGFGAEYRGEDLSRLFYVLTPEEMERYRKIGVQSTVLLEDAARQVRPGQTEYQIAGRTTAALMAAGFQVPVCLVASDERLLRYRHPVPAARTVERMVMVAVTVRKYGLNVSISRIVSFGPLDELTRSKQNAVAFIDAHLISATIPGAVTGEIVRSAGKLYKDAGFGGDYELHHQGGAMGYAVRYYCAPESQKDKVEDRMAFSWNPTIAGVKSEDTLIVTDGKPAVISKGGSWPQIPVHIGNKTVERPDILVF
jgi:Xaa-Pro aminopeptidase